VHKWIKCSDIIVFSDQPNNCLRLVNAISGVQQLLNGWETNIWQTWNSSGSAKIRIEKMMSKLELKGFARQRNCQEIQNKNKDSVTIMSNEKMTLGSINNHIKPITESPDLVILFDTTQMRLTNPVITLNGLESLCWRAVASNWTLAKLIGESWRIFAFSDVFSVIHWFKKAGFITCNPAIKFEKIEPYLRKELVEAPRVQSLLSRAITPWYCLWELNTKCDLRCNICYLPHFKSRGPSNEIAQQIVQQIDEANIPFVSLLGGEPLLRRDLEQIVEGLRSHNIFTKIISNGQTLTLERAETLADIGLNLIEISFDGLSATTHDASRGVGAYNKSIQAIRNAWLGGVPRVGIVLTVHSGNTHELSSLPSFMRSHSVKECYISQFKKTGALGSQSMFSPPSLSEIAALEKYIETWNETCPELRIVLLPSCSCGRSSTIIGYDCSLRNCSFSYKGVGNILEKPLALLWQSLSESIPKQGDLGYCALQAYSDNKSSDTSKIFLREAPQTKSINIKPGIIS